MRKRKALVFILIAVFYCNLLFAFSSCTPPPRYAGVPVYGVMVNGVGETEIKSVDCRLNIVDYPSRTDFKTTNSYVEVAYDFYNGTPYNCTVPLYLVAGQPTYEHVYGFDIVANCNRYQFTTSAEHNIDLRCAYVDGAYCDEADNATQVEKLLKCLHDEKQTDDYYNNDLWVYKYTFTFDVFSDRASGIVLQVGKEYKDVNVFLGNHSYNDYTYFNGATKYYVYFHDSDSVTFYSVGTDIVGIEQNIKFCNNSNIAIKNGGQITSVTREVLTFDDILMTYYSEESNLSEADWYNAALSYVKRQDLKYMRSLDYLDIAKCLCYAYQCNLTFPAQSDTFLTVEMPLYPTIDYGTYSADVYKYELDMSALSGWRGNPDIDVSIASNGYYVDSSAELTQTASGYEIKQVESLLEKQWFTLSPIPDYDKGIGSNTQMIIITVVVLLIVFAIPIVIVSLVLGLDHAKRKKKPKSAETTIQSKQ